ncbi:MAG: NAD-dependent succinate-semialdehyde dehydrogenase [Gemmatimonadetes bacterium]|nr:NAD-dependent succinate-semialdehyde dehydrogenase [Gemmatimonadota bacterium]
MKIESVNPATGERIRSYELMSPRQLSAAIRASARAYRDWRTTTFAERATLMSRAAELLRERAGEFARIMAMEMGKPVRGGRGEAGKCAWVCDYYAEHAERFLAPQAVATDARESFVAFRPIGPVVAVMPWNFPFWQVFRFAAPALMAGNVGLLKHASNVPGCALAIEKVFRDAGFPEHVFTTLLIETRHTRNAIRNRNIAAVTLTGSTAAGSDVARVAGQKVKKTVLELGGSDPYVILEDADIPAAVETCVTSRLINSGQSCIAAKRFIVVPQVRDEFEHRFVERMRLARMGDPLDENSDIGPQARRDLRDELHSQVRRSIEKGARLLLGGEVPPGPGAYYPPTVLAGVKRGMPAYSEELFGPAASIIAARNENDALRIANDSVFGLGAAVFTQDIERGRRIATDELEAGCCFVNSFVKSDPRLPFGGIRESGYGRELADFGIREFVNIKSVCVA